MGLAQPLITIQIFKSCDFKTGILPSHPPQVDSNKLTVIYMWVFSEGLRDLALILESQSHIGQIWHNFILYCINIPQKSK